ncbi:transposase [Streptomyces sp. NPDC059690]|uniref:transposase n=1 Tax=Streptomyces sp. NPDC059690 TaxID=3346907 RepID=UPI0036986D6C
MLTNTLGLVMAVLVTPASVTDRDGARSLLPAAAARFRQLARVWADGGYTGHLTDWTSRHLVLDIVRRSDVQGFQTHRAHRAGREGGGRGVHDQEAVIRWSMTALMIRRLAARPRRPAALTAG